MMTTTMTTTSPHETGRQKGVLKKVIKYLQDQAIENSSPRSVLSPPGLEPHQKHHHHTASAHSDRYRTVRLSRPQRRFSDATTAVDSRTIPRRPGHMAGDGTDAGVFLEDNGVPGKEMKKVQYAQDNILQNYKLYVPERDPATINGNQYWILFIHGGYFRDPKVDAASFRSALEILTSKNTTQASRSSLAPVSESAEASPASSQYNLAGEYDMINRHVAGYASINYRLSPHPDYPQDEDTENYLKRNARFPEQLTDVHAAIRHLQTRYEITNNYILAGHSVGATLSFLAALKAKDGQIDPPACVVGLNGIYDFPAIHESNPDYVTMTSNAMRSDQFQEASPAWYPVSDFTKVLPNDRLRVLISHSHDDGLVVWEQVEKMQKTLQAGENDTRLQVDLMETKGQHDAIWKNGSELARTLVKALHMVLDC